MRVSFHRLQGHRYYSTAERADGVTVFVPGYDRVTKIPHDLVHFIVERELRLPRGVWGSIASGGMFRNMKVISGRQGPHPAERSKEVLRAHGEDLTVAEALAAFFVDLLEVGTAQPPERLLGDFRRRTDGLPLPELTEERVVACRDALRKAAIQWRRVKVGEALTLEWPFRPTRIELKSKEKAVPHRRRVSRVA